MLYKVISRPDAEYVMCAPMSMRGYIMNGCHDNPLAGHLGLSKTYDIIQKQFYWPGMYRDTEAHIEA